MFYHALFQDEFNLIWCNKEKIPNNTSYVMPSLCQKLFFFFTRLLPKNYKRISNQTFFLPSVCLLLKENTVSLWSMVSF